MEYVQITTPDGYQLDATVQKPANFDPKRLYPVWLEVYAGPGFPTIRDNFAAGFRLMDAAKAREGYVVFHCDPRSASTRGAASQWTAYRKLATLPQNAG